jgi:hypothetical protein
MTSPLSPRHLKIQTPRFPVAWRSLYKAVHTPQELSNFCCLPAGAGETPDWISRSEKTQNEFNLFLPQFQKLRHKTYLNQITGDELVLYAEMLRGRGPCCEDSC